MTHRFRVEALDITLRDITRDYRPSGGKSILFSGDWRQIGPVVPFGDEDDVIEAAFISSPLFTPSERFRLTISQRDCEDAEYASFVRNIGEGRVKSYSLNSFDEPVIPLATNIDAPTTDTTAFAIASTSDSEDLVHFMYPDFASANAELLADRAILAPINETIDNINAFIVQPLQGPAIRLLSSDHMNKSDPRDVVQSTIVSPDHLNALNAVGIPPHELNVKLNAMLMVTRNLNFNERIVNGQKVQLLNVSSNARVLQVKLLDGSGDTVLLPQVYFTPQIGRHGLAFTRTQFPVRLAYACTMKKSQGQTLTKVGLDLRSPVFSHGQLYVALSRARGRRSVMSLVPPENLVDPWHLPTTSSLRRLFKLLAVKIHYQSTMSRNCHTIPSCNVGHLLQTSPLAQRTPTV